MVRSLSGLYRLFEKGINLKSIDGKSSAYIVLAPDSLRAEALSFQIRIKPEILDRRSLPNGGFALECRR